MRTVAVAVAALLAGGFTPAVAAEPEGEALDALALASPTTVERVVDIAPDTSRALAIEAPLNGTQINVPTDPAAGVTIAAGTSSLSIELPFSGSAHDAVAEGDGVVSYDNLNGSTTVPAVLEDGSLQIATVITEASAPTEYTYPVNVPEGAHLALNDTGGAQVVAADGEVLGVFGAPWAKDASGADVPTRYEVIGTQLRQVVDHEGFAYPVVADPTYTTTTFYYSRTDVEQMWTTLQTVSAVCSVVPMPYAISLSCRPPAALADAVASAHYQKKRIKAVYYYCGATYCNYYVYSVVT